LSEDGARWAHDNAGLVGQKIVLVLQKKGWMWLFRQRIGHFGQEIGLVGQKIGLFR